MNKKIVISVVLGLLLIITVIFSLYKKPANINNNSGTSASPSPTASRAPVDKRVDNTTETKTAVGSITSLKSGSLTLSQGKENLTLNTSPRTKYYSRTFSSTIDLKPLSFTDLKQGEQAEIDFTQKGDSIDLLKITVSR